MSDIVPARAAPALAPGGALLRLCEKLERLPANAVGALTFADADGQAAGSVLVQSGRVCWAVAAGAPRTLSDRLLGLPGAPRRRTLEEVFQACRADGKPLGEALVDRGLVTRETLRVALREHTAAAIRAIAGLERMPRWAPRATAYDPEFSFDPVELLVTAAEAYVAADALATAREAVRAHADVTTSIAAFACDSDEPGLPIALAGSVAGVDRLRSLGRWCRAAARMSHAEPGQPAIAVAGREDRSAVVVLADRGATIAFSVPGPQQLAVLLGRLRAALAAPVS